VKLVPRAETRTVTRRGAGLLQTTVPVVPDAPIGHFQLTIFGGGKGYLVNTQNLCSGAPPRSAVEYTAQNGKVLTQKIATKASCGKKSGRKNGKKRKFPRRRNNR